MELFDTHFVWFGQILAVSGQKTLGISNRYVYVSGKITTVPSLFSEHSLQSKKKTSDYECTH